MHNEEQPATVEDVGKDTANQLEQRVGQRVRDLHEGDENGRAGVVPLFFDASRGILQVSGDQWGPALYATSDGGQTWRPLPSLPSSGYPLALDFVDANNFWAIVTPPGWTKGNSPTRDWLYRSSDGGGTWKLVQADLPIGFPVSSLLFIDANHGFAAQEQGASTGPPVGSSTEVLATSDGGHTWKLVGQIKGS